MPILAKRPEGLSEQVFQAANMYADGRKSIAQDIVRVRRKRYWHRQITPDAGPTTLSFFQSQSFSKYVCNMNNGRLNNDQLFILTAVRVDVQLNVTIAGAQSSATVGTQAASAAGLPVTDFDLFKDIVCNGVLSLSVGNQSIIDDYGLHNFPAGGGISGYGNISNTTASTLAALNVWTNGAPDAGNAFTIPAYPIVPGRDVQAVIDWQALLNLNDAAGLVFRVVLDGVQFELPNN